MYLEAQAKKESARGGLLLGLWVPEVSRPRGSLARGASRAGAWRRLVHRFARGRPREVPGAAGDVKVDLGDLAERPAASQRGAYTVV